MQVPQRYAILSLLQAILGAVIVVATALAYELTPATLQNSSLTVSIAGLGALAAIYYLSVHQLLKRRWMRLSTVILSLISAATVFLVIVATGGLDSPYYALWLLGIVIAGVFGGMATGAATIVTLAFYGYEFWLHGSQSGYILTHAGQLAISLATAVISEWIHITLGRSSMQHLKVTQLTGQLNQEALKSNVLMASVGEGVLAVNANRQIQLFNPAAVRMTGWDERSAQNIDYRLVLDLHDAKGNKLTDEADPFTQVWQSHTSLVRSDLTMQTKGGHSVAISLSLSPIYDVNKAVSGGIALFRDISAEKAVARQRDEFISTASHEMRTPVAAIEGYLSLAMNPAVATVDVRAKGFLEKAHSSTQHLGQLFQDLLSITKMEDGNQMGAQEVFDLTKLVEEASSDMQFSAEKKSLELQFGATGGGVRGQHSVLPVYAVKGNPQRLREVVMNFIENAVKFTPQGSIHVTIGGTADTVTVSVTDTGIGIAAEDIPHLFQKFYRIDSTATRTIGGTGLGLYLCRTIIERLGGRVWIESKLGEGSSFKFSLPRANSNEIAAAQPVAAPATGGATPAAPAAAPTATASPTPPADSKAEPKKVAAVK
ncbi:MAG TPA: ATP-binding protein [Candidatus Saccharimonadales bacterium]|nr:ATP-binding protein [Candidatus Saccharimonadales bacterium]